jgi:hypothetical protein
MRVSQDRDNSGAADILAVARQAITREIKPPRVALGGFLTFKNIL